MAPDAIGATDYGVTPERRLPTAAGFIERVTGLPVMRPTTYWCCRRSLPRCTDPSPLRRPRIHAGQMIRGRLSGGDPCEHFCVNADWGRTFGCLGVSLCGAEVRLCTGVDRPVQTGRVASADDSLMMIILLPALGLEPGDLAPGHPWGVYIA